MFHIYEANDSISSCQFLHKERIAFFDLYIGISKARCVYTKKEVTNHVAETVFWKKSKLT